MASIIRVDEQALKGMNFKKKFDKGFGRLITMAAVAVCALAVTVIAALIGINTIYNRYYQLERLQGEIRIDVQAITYHSYLIHKCDIYITLTVLDNLDRLSSFYI